MIAVFGSINLDLVTHVPHIPAPGETVLGASYTRIPGGKGANQALAARRAGAKVALLGATGIDEFADLALSLLLAEGVDLSAIAKAPVPTGAAFISVDAQGQNAITVASGANGSAKGSQMERVTLHQGDVLLLQREVPDAEAEIAAKHAKEQGATIVLNLAPSGLIGDSYLELIDVLIMNEQEAADLARAMGQSGALAELAAHLDERFHTATVVTLGGEGAIGWIGGIESRVPANPVTVVDTTAAGDTFTGAFAAALEAGLEFPDAVRRGVVAGSLACAKPGAQTSIPTKAEIEAAL